MKCLTVRQPWAWAIVNAGIKRAENRSWPTKHRGPLAIHAAITREEFRGAYDFVGMMPGLPHQDELVYGAIIGVVDVLDCVPYEEAKHRPFAEPGGWCWILAEPRSIRPIPWRGALSLFTVPDHLVPSILDEAEDFARSASHDPLHRRGSIVVPDGKVSPMPGQTGKPGRQLELFAGLESSRRRPRRGRVG